MWKCEYIIIMYQMNCSISRPQRHPLLTDAQPSFRTQSFFPCLNTPFPDGKQLQSAHSRQENQKRTSQNQQDNEQIVYKVVLKSFSQLVSLYGLVLDLNINLHVIGFTISEQETRICLWIKKFYNQQKDLGMNSRLTKQDDNLHKYFFLPETKLDMVYKMERPAALHKFLISLLRIILSKPLERARIQQNSLVFEKSSNQNQHFFDNSYEGCFLQGVSSGNNNQSNQYIIQQVMTSEPRYFREINQILRRGHYLSLKQQWDRGLKNKLEDIEKHWDTYKSVLSDEIYNFTKLNKYKEFRINNPLSLYREKHIFPNFYELIYPKMNHFLHFFSTKLGIKDLTSWLSKKSPDHQQANMRRDGQNDRANLEKNLSDKDGQLEIDAILQQLRVVLQIKDNIADKIFQQLLRDGIKANKKQSKDSIRINQSMKLREYISSCQHFDQNSSHWGNLFSTFYHSLNQFKNHRYFSEIQTERLAENECLGCSKFFIRNQNIYDQEVCLSPIKVFPSIRKLKQVEANLKDEICGLLNSGGGIILFNCQQKYKGIYPQGASMTQKDKQQYQQRIYSYSTQFYPILQIKAHIHATFVPIISLQENQSEKQLELKEYHGEENLLKPYYRYKKRNYIKGRFVTRIKVVPGDPSLVYFWYVSSKSANEGDIRNFCQINHPDGGITKLKNKQIVRRIKKRMRKFYTKQSSIDQDRRLLTFPRYYLDHECPQPDIGVTIAEIPKAQIIQKLQPNNNNLEEIYNHLTLVVAKEDYHQLIRQQFRKNRFSFNLEVLFKQQRFKTAKNTAALFHNIKFQEVFHRINNNPNLVFAGRPALVVNVTSYLRLESRNQSNRLSQDQFQSIAKEFALKFPNETLKVFRFTNSNSRTQFKQQYFLLTQTKTSNLYLYYLINDRFGKVEKAVFKNPYLLDKLSQSDREKCMVKLFQRRGKNDLISDFDVKRCQSWIVNMRLVQSSDFGLDQQSDLPLYQKYYQQMSQQAQRFEITSNKPNHKAQVKNTARQQHYFYENWSEVLLKYSYNVQSRRRSLNIKDL